MAARRNKIRHDEETRLRIKAGNIITRLQKGIDGKVDLTGPQVAAALGLLRKILPDLTSAENTLDITTRYVALMPEVATTDEEWQAQLSPPAH